MVFIKSRKRNPNTKRNTFCQPHSSSYIKRTVQIFFISNSFQESVKKTDVLVAFFTNHSAITFSKSQVKDYGQTITPHLKIA